MHNNCCHKLKPSPSEYEDVGFNLVEVFKLYAMFLLVFIPLVGLHQETVNAGGLINKWVRLNVYKQGLTEEYFKEHATPFTSEVDECDYKTMTPKQFFNKYVATHTPCLFRDYAKIQPAFYKWQNETYLKEVAGDEIIFAEKQRDNRFAYFTEGAQRVYLPYHEFLDAFKVENRTFHYYYSFAEPPGELNKDLVLPPIMEDLFDISKVTYWHGFGTLTRPHTDAMENMMCMFEGYKNFSIAASEARPWIYAGTQGYPDNYSPLEFVKPDHEKYPLSVNATIKTIHIAKGDCAYIPAYYWHQVASGPSVSIGVATFFRTFTQTVDLFNVGAQSRVI